MAEVLRLEAAAGFDAARRLASLPAADPRSRWHGHSFLVAARAQAHSLDALQRATAAAVAPLDHQPLHELIGDAGDGALARWIAERIDQPGLDQVVLHAGPSRGALWTPGGTQHWRRYSFEAAHRLPHVPLAHKCGRMHGHGFGVVLLADATHDQIDDAWAPLHLVVHHRCLNHIEGLDNPTSEMLAAWLWQQLRPGLTGLQRVTVFETGSSGAAYDGERFRIWKQFTLDSAVRDERGLYGHTFALRLHLSAPLDQLLGWVVDFGDVKALFSPVFEQLDHQPLHELAGLNACDCASLAHWVYQRASLQLPQLDRIDLHQTPGCGAVLARDAAALVPTI